MPANLPRRPALVRGAAAIVLTLIAGPGLAEQMTITRAVEAASLHEGPLDMMAYYVQASGGALEVIATFAPRETQPTKPMRIVMALDDGDDVAFAMPGYPQAFYRFARDGEAVTVSVREIRSTRPTPAGL